MTIQTPTIPFPNSLLRYGSPTIVSASDEHVNGTILDELVSGQAPSIMICNKIIQMPPLSDFRIRVQNFYTSDGVPIGKVCTIPALLADLDTAIVTGSMRQDNIYSALSAMLNNNLFSMQIHSSALYRHFLVSSQIGDDQVGITQKMARALILNALENPSYNSEFIKTLALRMPTYGAQVNLTLLGHKVEVTTGLMQEAKLALSGLRVPVTRYPISSSTSMSKLGIVILRNAPGNALYLSPKTLTEAKGGDCDGDAGTLHIPSSKLIFDQFMEVNPYWKEDLNKPLVWRDVFPEGPVPIPVQKNLEEVAIKLLVNREYSGQTTYFMWMFGTVLASSKEPRIRNLFPTAKDSWNWTLDIFYPALEGIMDARKLTSSGELFAAAWIKMGDGRTPWQDVLSTLPVEEEGTRGTDKLTLTQVHTLHQVLSILSEGSSTWNIRNGINGLDKYWPSAIFARRANPDILKEFISENPGVNLYQTMYDSLFGLDPGRLMPARMKPSIGNELGEFNEEY